MEVVVSETLVGRWKELVVIHLVVLVGRRSVKLVVVVPWCSLVEVVLVMRCRCRGRSRRRFRQKVVEVQGRWPPVVPLFLFVAPRSPRPF